MMKEPDKLGKISPALVHCDLSGRRRGHGFGSTVAAVRLYVAKSNHYTYPDVMIIHGKIELDPRQKDTVMNPVVLFDVFDGRNWGDARGNKFKERREIPALQDYVMIDWTRSNVDYFRRDGNLWIIETFEQLDETLTLRSFDISIPLETIYSQIEWQDKSNSGSET